jgi:hypothetical protein
MIRKNMKIVLKFKIKRHFCLWVNEMEVYALFRGLAL